jgi:hypothetical protein
MNKISLALCGLVLAALPSTAALADTVTFDFSFSNPTGFSGSGVFTADTTGTTGEFLIKSVTGSVELTPGGTSVDIDKLLAPNKFPASGPNDNLLFFPELSSPEGAFDASGVSFSLDDGSKVNLFLSNGEDVKASGGKQVEQFGNIVVTEVAPVPEPGTLALFGTGVLGLAGVIRRRLAI